MKSLVSDILNPPAKKYGNSNKKYAIANYEIIFNCTVRLVVVFIIYTQIIEIDISWLRRRFTPLSNVAGHLKVTSSGVRRYSYLYLMR